uniref:Uncharacterized protein n=2 Tax=Gossypium TaxID=3633 RepID=A0A0D2SVR2_GOSRA|nr:hypothetical protein B456_007G350100 [Gossypium raimondii]
MLDHHSHYVNIPSQKMVARITGSFKEIELCNKMAMVYDFNGVGQKSTFFMEYLLGIVYIQV